MSRRRDPAEFIERLGAIKRRISALAAQAYAAADVGSLQAKLLRQIGRSPDVTQAELARLTDSDPTLTSRTIASLEERGLVRRERSATDKREYQLELTASGKRLRDRLERLRDEVAARVVGGLDERDHADFERIANRILAALEDERR